jgi:hypothetical protein
MLQEVAAERLGAAAQPEPTAADDEAFSFTMLSGRDAPSTARRFATDRTEGWAIGAAGFNVQLLLSELVTNAVAHGAASAAAPIRVEGALIGRSLGIEVTNDGPRFEHAAHLPPDTDCGGRGLALVDAIAARWGARHHAGHTTVWFELDLDD